MVKPGRAYEMVVAEILQAMEPSATVEGNQWIQGSDGRRDMDVLVIGTVAGTERSIALPVKSNYGCLHFFSTPFLSSCQEV